MSGDMLVRNVNQFGVGLVDVAIANGKITAIGPDLPETSRVEVINAGKRLIFPGFVDAHAHLDKSLLGLGWYRNEVGPGLSDKIDNERRMRVEQDIDFHRQSSRQARRSIAGGTTGWSRVTVRTLSSSTVRRTSRR
ncbi:hypothetical protein BH23CHL2_BH23CHL2_29380 [soil metagenome]